MRGISSSFFVGLDLKAKAGFSFLELMVVVMLIGITATIVVPNLTRLIPGYQRKTFITELNSLLMVAWRGALSTQKVHRLMFDVKNNTIRVEVQQDEKKFEALAGQYTKTMYPIPTNIEIKQLFVGKNDQLHRPGIKTEEIWFFIMPNGMTQEVVINIIDTSDYDVHNNPRQIGLVLNPFTAQLSVYETFQKP